MKSKRGLPPNLRNVGLVSGVALLLFILGEPSEESVDFTSIFFVVRLIIAISILVYLNYNEDNILDFFDLIRNDGTSSLVGTFILGSIVIIILTIIFIELSVFWAFLLGIFMLSKIDKNNQIISGKLDRKIQEKELV